MAVANRPKPFKIRVTEIDDPLPDATFGSIGRYVQVAFPDDKHEPFVPHRLVLSFDEKQAEHVDPWTLAVFEVDSESRSFTLVENSAVDVDGREVSAWVDHPGTYGVIGLPKDPALLETLHLLDRYGPQLFEESELGERGLQDRICGLILGDDPAKWGGESDSPGDLYAQCLNLDPSFGQLPEKLLLERRPPLREFFPPHLQQPGSGTPPPGTASILAWGMNPAGVLGDGSTMERDTAVWVPGFDARKIVGANDMTVALAADGTVWSWGSNSVGQLGDGTMTPRLIPGRVANITGVVDIAAHDWHALAVRSDGSVWRWGRDVSGGNFETQPVKVAGLTDAVAVAAGDGFNLVLTRFGRVWSWGDNSRGQLGDGSRAFRSAPALVPSLTSVQSIAAAPASSFAVKTSGDLFAWGAGDLGTLGIGGNPGVGLPTDRLTPVQVPGLTYIQQVVASTHVLARDIAGDVWGWGVGGNGQIGDGSTSNRQSPLKINALHGKSIRALAVGDAHSVALEGQRTVWTWGWNGAGQLGDGSQVERHSPISKLLPTGRNGIGVGAGPTWSFAILG
jgi:alpha-tubulin suppressor-like RCC1 family protein